MKATEDDRPLGLGLSEGLGAADTEGDAPGYWFGPGHAPMFSRAVAAANQTLKRAEEELQATLKREYPEGRHVTVIHHRGMFWGRIVGWDYYGCRVAVQNEVTGKVSKWWAAHVQLSA